MLQVIIPILVTALPMLPGLLLLAGHPLVTYYPANFWLEYGTCIEYIITLRPKLGSTNTIKAKT